MAFVGNEVEKALREAEDLLETIKIYNLTGREKDAEKQLKKVNELLKNVTEYKQPVDKLEKEIEEIKAGVKEFNDKLDDLYNHTQYSLNTANDAKKLINKSG